MNIEDLAELLDLRPIGLAEVVNPIESENGNRYDLMQFIDALYEEIRTIKRRTGIGIANLSSSPGFDLFDTRDRR